MFFTRRLMPATTLPLLALLALAADGPPLKRDKAELVVVGTVKSATEKSAEMTATVTISKVERAVGGEPPKHIDVSWPMNDDPDHSPGNGDVARFWLAKTKAGKWIAINNSDAIEVIERAPSKSKKGKAKPGKRRIRVRVKKKK